MQRQLSLRARPRAALSVLVACVSALAASSCGATRVDLDAWRAREVTARPLEARGEPAAELADVGRLRAARRLAEARTLALQLAAERPEDAAAALAASRAESDGLVLRPRDDRDARDSCAASALDHAQLAARLGLASAEARARLAYTLGATTHLQAMSARSGHARRTLEAAHEALALDPANAEAHATVAVVHLRLETLPWIAKLMARGRPDSSLEAAERHARAAFAAEPSREYGLVLAKVLRAADRDAEARAIIEAALASDPAFPLDEVVEPELRAMLGAG